MSRVTALLLAFLLLGLSAVATALALADLYRGEGAGFVDEWSMNEEQATPPPWAWEQAHRYLWLANRLAPLDPDIRNDLGRLFELRVTQEQADAPLGKADLERALSYYRQSIALRPAWPYVWTNIMMLKPKQNRLDAEFSLAMQRTAQLGPGEEILQVAIAGGGLSLWERLPADLQSLVEHTVARGLLEDTWAMWSVADEHGLIPVEEAAQALIPTAPPYEE